MTADSSSEIGLGINTGEKARLCLTKIFLVRATAIAGPALLNLIIFPPAHVADVVRAEWIAKHEKAATRTGMLHWNDRDALVSFSVR